MEWNDSIWLGVALVTVVCLGIIGSGLLQRQSRGSALGPATAWTVGAVTSAFVMVDVGVRIRDLAPVITNLDVVAIGITGVLTGLFLARAWAAWQHQDRPTEIRHSVSDL